MTTLIIVPVRHRPHRVEPLLASITGATPEPHRVLFVCSTDDQAQIDAVVAAGAEHIDIPWARGDYARKVNTAVAHSDEPLIFLGADDLRFHPGWLTAACARLAPGIGVVGTNDLGNARVMSGQHATHCLVARAYAQLGTIDDPTRLLHEGYWHEFVDDELVGTAKKRRAWSFAPDSIVEHLHPAWGKAPLDALYAEEPERMRYGRRIYARRRRLWK